ncbi:MAG: hypothetical protein H8E13_15955 [Actinobacteria bacterium]|nr:hypothetical protein [Actinomycetota bacterium]
MKRSKIFSVAVVLGLLALAGLVLAGCESEYAGETAATAIGAGLAGVWICMIVVGSLIGLCLFALWIITIIDCAKRKPDEFPNGGENTKTIWLVALIASWFVFSLWWLAGILYYFMVMRKKPRKK